MPVHPSSFMTLLTLACSAGCLLTWMREDFRYSRPFGISDAESLMELSAKGTLHCHCEPTDPAQPANDRRRSCRACGCAIVTGDPSRLYLTLSREQIEQITWDLKRVGIANAKGVPAGLTSLLPEGTFADAAELSR